MKHGRHLQPVFLSLLFTWIKRFKKPSYNGWKLLRSVTMCCIWLLSFMPSSSAPRLVTPSLSKCAVLQDVGPISRGETLRERLVTILRDEFTDFAGIWDQSILALCGPAIDAAGRDISRSLENVVSDGWKWATTLLTEPLRCSTKESSTLMLLGKSIRIQRYMSTN